MMKPTYLVACFVSVFLVSIAGVSLSGANEGASVSPIAAASDDWSEGDDMSLPAGISAEWWAHTPTAIRQLQHPNPDVPVPLRPRASWTAEGEQRFAYFGNSVGTAGDVNCDGYEDVIVGAYSYSNGESEEGRAFVYYGSASGLPLTPDWTAESNQYQAYFGISVGTTGDVNGDGCDDVIVGAYEYDNPQLEEGRAFVYYGSASGLSLTPDWTAESDQFRAYFAGSGAVGTAGDVNGDGYDDVIIGALNYDHGETDEGRAFVYHGSASGPSATPDWTAEGNQVDARFGKVASAGDVNGDGYDDVIVGAYEYDNGQLEEGRAFVYYGSASGLSLTPDWTAESDHSLSGFGISVDTAGDVNDDGYDDVIVGAATYAHGYPTKGRAFVYYGSAAGLSATADWTAESDQARADFGISVGTAGDVDGDGYDDVIVGADAYDNGQFDDAGRAFVYYGSASGLSRKPGRMVHSNQYGAECGHSVGTAGDVNGDGYDDVIVGGPGYNHGQVAEGGAAVFQGRPR